MPIELLPKDVTWAVSSGSIIWLGTEPDWAADAVDSYRLVSWRYNGSIMFLSSSAAGGLGGPGGGVVPE